MAEIFLIVLLWLFLFLQALIFIGILTEPKPAVKKSELPFISILVAARNEEENIEACLNSLLKLDYPPDLYEILVGNDGSTDRTGKIIDQLSNTHSRLLQYQITGELGLARAKANVLAQLFHRAKGDYIFVTDADITVAPMWVKSLLPYLFKPNTAIVSGTTIVDGPGFFDKMQGLEWLLASGNLLGLDHLGVKGTAVGNNMAFTREAYMKTGGYEKIPFSVTEDFQLFKHMRQLGYQTYNLGNYMCINVSKAQSRFIRLLHQRKRWMIGAQGLPWYWFVCFLILSLYAPALLMLFFINVKLALWIGCSKLILQSGFMIYLQRKFHLRTNVFHLLVFEPYTYIINFLMLVFYLMPVKMDWKERKY